jgi:anaerobic magnesium-protoporphyrin IX monomethyl ester cyclase
LKIVWLFPPSDGFPNVSQYRFFKRMPIQVSIIYPYLAASGVTLLHESGHDARLMDCPTCGISWRAVEAQVADADVVILEARAPIMNELAQCISRVKENSWRALVTKRPFVVVYGDHVSWDPGEGLRAGADVVIQGGDYDWGVFTLIQALTAGEPLPQIWNPGLLKNLKQLPWVDRELVNYKPYYEAWRERNHFFWLMSSRGCPYSCIYCSWTGTLWENRIRFRDPEDVANEMNYLYQEYGSLELLDDADCFSPQMADRGQIQRLELFEISEDQIRWGVQTHPNMISDLDLMKRLKAVGLSLVKLGLESGNQITLDTIHKNLKIEQSVKAIRILQDAEISVHANMIVGWPWESKEMAYHSIEWIKKLRPNQAQFSLLIPYPNTELFDVAKSNGWLTVPAEDYSKLDASRPMLKMVNMSSDDVVKLYQDAWRLFYLDPKYIIRKLLAIHDLGSIRQLINGYKSVTKGHMKAVEAHE